jgi:tetratricopeptide (TPR) repeat protein
MAPQNPSPRRRILSGNVSRRRGALLALMLGVVGCGPPEVEYIHVTEGSNGFVAMSKVDYQAAPPAELPQLPNLPENIQQDPAATPLNPTPATEPEIAVPPNVISELSQPGPALESTLSGLPESALGERPVPEVFESQEPRVVPLRTSVKPTPDLVPERVEGSAQPPLNDLLMAYRTQSRTTGVGLDGNELRAVNKPSEAQPELSSAAERAARRVAAGSRLVERGATLSGRQEFIGALQVIAEALDQQRHTNAHARALSAGLTALEEARDFVSSSPQQRLPLGELVLGHQTTVLQDVALDQLSNQDALQSYLNYAQQQLSTAGGDLLPGADALFALGKLHLLESQQPSNSAPRLELERAIMLFHAALVIEPKHSLAANEAGVALARLGRMNEAKLALQHSASLTAHPSTWRNLATVHQSLGEGQLAQLAERESQTAKDRWQAQSQATGQLAGGSIQVVDNGTFAQAAPVNTFDSANRGQQPLANAPAQGSASGNNTAPSQGQPQPTIADPQVRSAPRQPWGAAATPAARTATPPQYGAGQLR